MGLTCPYCKHDLGEVDSETCHPDHYYNEISCANCNKLFVAVVEYFPSYTTWEAPCLNGGEHKLQQIYDHNCVYCGKDLTNEQNS
jgi:hypothetical protein